MIGPHARSRGSTQPKAPRRWTKPLEWALTRCLLGLLCFIGRLLPGAARSRLGRCMGRLAYRVMARYRKVALANIARAFPEWEPERCERLAREAFDNVGLTIVEFFLQLPRLTEAEVGRLVRFEGQEHYESALGRGKGVILVTAHYGNWEMMGPALQRSGYQVSAVSRTQEDPGLERSIEAIRVRSGMRQLPRKSAAREGLATLKRNEILAILLDQNAAEGGVFVPFFGHPASTAVGPAIFALKTGAAIVPTFCIRNPDGTHVMRAHPPIIPEPTGDRAADAWRLTARMTSVIEAQIREQPELWCWLHNRWKLQPAQGTEAPGAVC